jgi:hypothetical protein
MEFNVWLVLSDASAVNTIVTKWVQKGYSVGALDTRGLTVPTPATANLYLQLAHYTEGEEDDPDVAITSDTVIADLQEILDLSQVTCFFWLVLKDDGMDEDTDYAWEEGPIHSSLPEETITTWDRLKQGDE